MSKQNIICEYSQKINNALNTTQENLKFNLRVMWEYLPELPFPQSIGYSIGDSPWFTYPYDKFLKQEIKDAMLNAGWSLGWEVTEAESGNKNPKYCFNIFEPNTYHSFSVIFEFDPTIVGSTCVRKKIGQEQKLVDIFEYVCPEAAEE